MLQSDTMLPHGCGSPGGRSMTQPADVGRALTHEQLPRLHHITNEVAKICRGQLRTYLDALAPLFRPRRVLGNHMDGAGKETVAAADQNINELREIYFKACPRRSSPCQHRSSFTSGNICATSAQSVSGKPSPLCLP